MSTHGEAVEDIKKAKEAVEFAETKGFDFKSLKNTHPDPKLHRNISFAKSVVRIGAGLALAGGGWLEMNPYIMWAGVALVAAEVLGIAEELV